MSAEAPHALAAWYPIVCAAARSLWVVGAEHGASAVRAAWAELAAGDALAVHARARGHVERLARAGRRGAAERLVGELAGAARIDRWIVLPNTGGSHVLLPPTRAGFAAGARLLPAGRRRWRVLRRALVALARVGLVGRLGLDELCVALKGEPGAALANAPLAPWAAARTDAEVTVALGVPGRFRKAVVLSTGRAGAVHGVLKLALTHAARDQVRREADALERLGALDLGQALAPALLARGSARETPWMVQRFVDGQRSPDALGPAHFAFLCELHAASSTRVALDELDAFRGACARLAALEHGLDAAWLGAMLALRDALRARAGGELVRCCLSHGDFTPWNLLLRGGRLVAFDWEFAEACAPVLFDLVHFHVQTGVLVRHVAARALLAELEALADGAAREHLRALGLAPADALVHAGLYVLHIATLDEETNRIERPPFAQVEWLRRARVELARELARALAAPRGAARGAA